MIESMYMPQLIAGNMQIFPGVRPTEGSAREKYLLWRATAFSIEGALRFGRDLPVGAAVGTGDIIPGGFFASDNRTGFGRMHAEERAIAYSEFAAAQGYPNPDILGVTVEPCSNCQDIIAAQRSIRTVVFLLDRSELSDRGLVNPRPGIRDGINPPPFEVVQIADERLAGLNRIVFDSVYRDPASGTVEIDTERLLAELPTHPSVMVNPFMPAF